MGTNLDLDAALREANTTHVVMGQELYRGVTLSGPYQLWTDTAQAPGGVIQNNFLTNEPLMRRWTGARQLKSLRAYTQEMRVDKHEATLVLERQLVQYDQTGAVSKKIGEFHRNTGLGEYNRLVASVLDGTSGNGPTGYDAVALFNASHPHVNSGSGHSNTGTSSLTHANFNATRTAMRQYKNEQGETMDIAPTHLRCGPQNEQKAKEVCEAKDRIAFTSMLAAETATAVQNTTLMPNVWAGEVMVVIDPQVDKTSGQTYYWDLMDLSKPGKPMILVVSRTIEAIARTDMTDPHRFDFDEFLFGLEGDHDAFAGFWPTIYRQKATA